MAATPRAMGNTGEMDKEQTLEEGTHCLQVDRHRRSSKAISALLQAGAVGNICMRRWAQLGTQVVVQRFLLPAPISAHAPISSTSRSRH